MLELTKPKDLREIAQEYLTEAGGDTAAATRRLVLRLRDDEALRTAIAKEAIEAFAYLLVEQKMRNERMAIWTANSRAATPKTPVSALANGLVRALLDFPLAGGKRLRDATREEVLEQARIYTATARDASQKALWLRMIAARTQEGMRVGDCITEEAAATLRAEAQSTAIVLECEQ